MKRLFALVLLAVGFSAAAHATPMTWTDSINFSGNSGKIGWWDSLDYTHDMNDNGFRPGVDQIDSYSLSINLGGGAGWAYIDLPSDRWNEGDGQAASWDFSATGEDFGGWSLLGLVHLNDYGTLSVTISSILGEFTLASSTLTAIGSSGPSTSVPEPGMLGLMGVGLLGMALGVRRRKQASR